MFKKGVIVVALIAVIVSVSCLAVFAKSAERKDATVVIDGRQQYLSLYDIEGYKCIMIRDIAEIMKNSDKQFDVIWNADKKTIHIITEGTYEGSELKRIGSVYPKYKKKSGKVYVNDILSDYSIYEIEDRSYIRIRDIADIIGFNVVWSSEENSLFINRRVEKISDMVSDVSDIRNLSQLFEGDYVSYLEKKCNEKIDTDNFVLYDEHFVVNGENDIYEFNYSGMQDFIRAEIVNYYKLKFIAEGEEETAEVTETTTEEVTQTTERTIDPSKPVIALTFDDGPRAGSTERIVNVLKQYDARATFFVVGQNVEKNPDLVKLAVDSGCQIGNHSYSHSNLNKLSEYAVKTEIAKTSNAVYDASGVYPYIGRPPYGSVNPTVRNAANIEWFNWSVDTLDWKYKDKDYVANTVINSAKDGAVVLMHDLQPTTADAMEIAIPKLVEMGYQLITIDEMRELYGTENVNGYIKPDRVIK